MSISRATPRRLRVDESCRSCDVVVQTDPKGALKKRIGWKLNADGTVPRGTGKLQSGLGPAARLTTGYTISKTGGWEG